MHQKTYISFEHVSGSVKLKIKLKVLIKRLRSNGFYFLKRECLILRVKEML